MSHHTLWLGNDNDIKLDNLQVVHSSANVSGATVTATVKNGTSVIAGASDITLAATSAGSNDYRGVLSSTVTLPRNARVTVDVAVSTTAGENGLWSLDARTRVRGQ